MINYQSYIDYLMFKHRYTLAKMYGRIGGYEPDSLSDDQFRYYSIQLQFSCI